LPVSKTAEKELRAARRKQERNKAVRSLAKTKIKKAVKAITAGDVDMAKTAVIQAISTLDRAAEKKVIHKNTAARKKSRLMKKLNAALSAKSTTEQN